MSRFHEGYVWRFSKAKGNARLVLMVLAEAADDDGFATLSHPQIAGEARVDPKSVARLIGELIGLSDLQIAVEARGSRPATYHVSVDVDALRSAFTTWPVHPDAAPHDIPPGQPETLTAAPERADTEGPQVEETAAIEGPDDGGNSPAAEEAPVAGGAVQPYPFTEVAVPVPVSPEMVPTLIDAEHSRMRRMAEAIATPLHDAPAIPAPKPYMPPAFPPGEVGRVLLAAGVDPLARGALYWWRRDHRADLAHLVEATGLTVDQIARHLTESGQKHPDIARLAALEDILKGADRG